MSISRRQFQVRPPLLFLLGAAFMLCMKVQHSICQWDLLVYYEAAKAVWQGMNPYDLPAKEGYEGLTVLTVYLYPPLFARVLSPLHWLPVEAVRLSWFVIQALCFEALYWFGLRLFGQRFGWISWMVFHLVGIRYDGVETDFRAGNTALMEAAAITAWATFHLRRPVVSGSWLGVLTAVKPFTVFILIWDIVGKRWRACLGTAATAGLLGFVMFCDRPLFDRYREFLASPTFQNIMDEHTVGIFNHATVSVAFRLFTDKTMFLPVLVFPPLAYFLTFAVPLLAWLAAFSIWRKLEDSGLSADVANRLGFGLLLPTVLLTTPRVADYTLVWLLGPFFFQTWVCWKARYHGALILYLTAGVVGNLPITGGMLNEDTFQLHWLHFRYASLALFWFAGLVMARAALRRTNGAANFMKDRKPVNSGPATGLSDPTERGSKTFC